MRKTYMISVLTVGLAFVLLLSLGSPTPNLVNAPGSAEQEEDIVPQRTPPAAAVELHVALSVSPGELNLLEQATQLFMQRHPHVKVRVENIPEQLAYDRYLQETSLGTAPDLMLLNSSWIRDFATEGRLRALDDVIAVERQNRWFDTLLQNVRWNGYIWAVPMNWDPYVIVYDSASFQFAAVPTGFSLPETVTDWLQRLGKPVLDRSDEQAWNVISEGIASAPVVVDIVPVEAEAEAVEEEEQPFNALGLLTEAWNKGTEGPLGAMLAVQRGDASWTVSPLSEALKYGELRSSSADQRLMLTYLPLPDEGIGRSVPPFAGRSFVVSPDTPYAQEAADWISFITENTLHSEGRKYAFGFPADVNAYEHSPLSPAVPAYASAPSSSYQLRSLTVEALGPLMRAVDSAAQAEEGKAGIPAGGAAGSASAAKAVNAVEIVKLSISP